MKNQVSKNFGTEINKDGVIEVWTTLDLKISKNYNTLGASVGMKAVVGPEEDPMRKLKILQAKIEKILKKKSNEIGEALG